MGWIWHLPWINLGSVLFFAFLIWIGSKELKR